MSDQTPRPSQAQAPAEQLPFTREQALARLSVLETLAINNAVVLLGMIADAQGLTDAAIEKHLNLLRDTTVQGVARLGSEAITSVSAEYADAVFKVVFNKVKESREARQQASRADRMQ
ncbi:hypothetical protein [Microvirga tunisiensis]|uniref:Uncharacterized protein n=1 Tax=Microvirga tunisiensis TaxID=2108360 RepID=A0A5N7MQP1_9HYPH|nr:hypothetical protein [Microvirga tunisiensis]MPR10696.1 hypothetical protein [Microvirga tunisiensis]MPR28769.1 hypothetical protein [Microvirga tunisiensis]